MSEDPRAGKSAKQRVGLRSRGVGKRVPSRGNSTGEGSEKIGLEILTAPHPNTTPGLPE